jgi:hypothetical protein
MTKTDTETGYGTGNNAELSESRDAPNTPHTPPARINERILVAQRRKIRRVRLATPLVNRPARGLRS